MRRISTLSVLCLAAGVMSACSLPDEIIKTENIPTAGVRFINATPDTNMVDFRFVDIVESNAQFRQSFRNLPITASGVPASTQVQYKNARAGIKRHFRVFLDDTLQTVASTVLLDDSTTFTAGSNYTVMMWGNARSAGADKLHFSIWEDAAADPGANVGIRLINATNAVINGHAYLSTGAAGAATWAAVPAYGCIGACGTAGNWVPFAPTTGANTIKVNVRDAGDVTALSGLAVDASALIGAVASASTPGGGLDIIPLPGTAVAGSAITAIVFPPSVAGSKGAQFATVGTSFGITFVWDRRPPNGCSATIC